MTNTNENDQYAKVFEMMGGIIRDHPDASHFNVFNVYKHIYEMLEGQPEPDRLMVLAMLKGALDRATQEE